MLLKFGVLHEQLLVKVLPSRVSEREAQRETENLNPRPKNLSPKPNHGQRACLHSIALVDNWYPVLLHRHVPPQQRVEVQPAEVRMRLDVAPAP
jgi:hypothetical protein